MAYSVQQINDPSIWNAFLDRISPHTFLQDWAWSECQEARNIPTIRVGIYANNSLCGVALFFVVQARRGTHLLCPHGPLFEDEAHYSSGLAELTTYATSLAKERSCVCVRICPLLIDTEEHRSMYKTLGLRDAPTHVHPELSWMLHLQPSCEELLKGMRKTTRQMIRKAEQDGVTVHSSDEIGALDDFMRVYQTTVSRQHFTPFSRTYLETEFTSFAKRNQAMIFTGTYQGEIISSAIILFSRGSAFYHHGASDQSRFPKVPAAHLLQWEIIQEAKRRGCAWYNFWGVSPEDKPKHPWHGLSLFKRGFGGVPEAYVHAQDLVLSKRYWVLYAIEALRRRKRGL